MTSGQQDRHDFRAPNEVRTAMMAIRPLANFQHELDQAREGDFS